MYQGWDGRGSANFLVDWGQPALRQTGLKVLPWPLLVPLKEVLGWGAL